MSHLETRPAPQGIPGLIERIQDRTDLEHQRLAEDLARGDEQLLAMDYQADRAGTEMWRRWAVNKAAKFAVRASTQAARAEERGERSGIVNSVLGFANRGLAKYFGWRQRNNEWSVGFYNRRLATLEAEHERETVQYHYDD